MTIASLGYKEDSDIKEVGIRADAIGIQNKRMGNRYQGSGGEDRCNGDIILLDHCDTKGT